MQNYKLFHVLRVKYLGATNFRGSRVKITSDRFKQSVSFGYRHEMNGIEDMAIAELKKRAKDGYNSFHIVGVSDGYVITDTFEPLTEKARKCYQLPNGARFYVKDGGHVPPGAEEVKK